MIARLRLSAFALALPLFGAAPLADAFDFAPIAQDFEPVGRGATQVFRAENTGAQPIAVEISVYALDMAPDGTEKRTPAEDLFTVYPPQIVLLPQQTQAVRVQWIGPPKPDRELVYRLIAEQLPVDLAQEQRRGARINLLLKYEAILYVVPPGAKGELKLVSVEPSEGKDGQRHLAITIENRGSAHGRIVDPKLQLTATGSGTAVTLGSDQLSGLEGLSVLAGKTRRFLVPWPQSLPVGPVAGEITFEMER